MCDTDYRSDFPLESDIEARDELAAGSSFGGRPGLHHVRDAGALLASGGLDSCILLKYLLDMGRKVKPLYIDSGLCWQTVEKLSLKRYIESIGAPPPESLTVLDLPLADLYGDHWSITGHATPEAGTPDQAVFLLGRNILLTVKAANWCQTHGVNELAIGTLKSNPFQDASALFFDQLGQVCSSVGPLIRFRRPFAELDKRQVMELGRTFPLDSTFSCISPHNGLHCGHCNKCAERKAAFRLINTRDPTHYTHEAAGGSKIVPQLTIHDCMS